MNRNVKIGLIQMSSVIGDVNKNINRATEKIKKASADGAEIVCLPELFAIGYDMNQKNLYSSNEALKNSEFVIARISDLAREEKIYIIAPTIIEKENAVFNSVLLFDKYGNILGQYNKVHLFEKEREIFRRGDSFGVWDTDIGKIGIMMCYDAGFPEVARILTLNGADIIFCPAAWRVEDKIIWKINLFQRAFENTVFIVGVNSVTQNNELHLFGGSRIIYPDGAIFVEAAEDLEENIICEINLDEIKRTRFKIQYLKDRCPGIYNLK